MWPKASLSFLFLVACCAVAPALLANRADAADPGTCTGYVQRMKELSEKARYYKCGFWEKFDPEMSRRWCLRVKLETITETRATDYQKMDRCAACRAYADAANDDARDNQLFRCGFSGRRWLLGDGSSNDPHFTWCMGLETEVTGVGFAYAVGIEGVVPYDHVYIERRERRDAIAQCKAKISEKFSKSEIEQCENYAKKAISDAKFNAQKKCGATLPGRWSQNEQDHFMWCLPKIGDPDGKKEVEREQAIRTSGVESCKEGRTLNADGQWFIPSLGKRKPDGGGVGGGKSVAGRSLSGGQNGASMAKGNEAGSAGISTARSAPSAVSRDPKVLQPKSGVSSTASGGAYTSRNNPSGGSSGSNRAMSPGLLDGDSGFAAAGPAGAGSSVGGAASGVSTGTARTYSTGTGSSGSFGSPRGGASGGVNVR
jgi:hypothetical protein